MKKTMTSDLRGPARASLREMPEVDFGKATVRRNPYAKRVAAEGIVICERRGRPKKGDGSGPTVPRSVRFPALVWKRLEARAKAEGLALHAALRAAVLAWLRSHAAAPPSR